MRSLVFSLLAGMALGGFATSSLAACRWEWVCDGSGACSHVPICNHALDIAPPEPPSIPPIAHPSVRPFQPPTIPPIGTQRCMQVQRQGFSGWYWDTVCY